MATGLEKECYVGITSPGAKFDDVHQIHRRAELGTQGTAGGKTINRVQDCNPMLRTDFRERWHERTHPEVERAVRRQSVKVDLGFLKTHHTHKHRSVPEDGGIGLRGTSDFKTVNRMQKPHPVLRDAYSYQSYLKHTGTAHPRALADGQQAGPHPSTITAYKKSWEGHPIDDPRQRAAGDARLDARLHARSHTSLGFLPKPVRRPTPLHMPLIEEETFGAPPSEVGSSADNAKAPVRIAARRELLSTRPLRSPPLPPSLSRLSPVPTLSWNGTSMRHPILSNTRNQGLWQEEVTPLGPVSLRQPLSPGSGTILTPGVGRSIHSRGGGRWLEPHGMAAYNLHSAERSPPQSPTVTAPYAGGGGAKEMRQRTKGDRIWLAGQSWMSFS